MLAAGGAVPASLRFGLGRGGVSLARWTGAAGSPASRPFCILGRRRALRGTSKAQIHRHLRQSSTSASERRGGGSDPAEEESRDDEGGAKVDEMGTAKAAEGLATSDTNATGRSNRKIVTVVALSGGVDSSVALYLLREKLRRRKLEDQDEKRRHDTHEVRGLFMNNWDPSQNENDDDLDESSRDGSSPSSSSFYCERTERDMRDAHAVCDSLNIPLHLADFSAEYWTDVFEPYVNAIVSSTTSGGSSGCLDGLRVNGDGGGMPSSQSLSSSCGGVMPNPDVECNRLIKFGAMRRYIEEKFGRGGDGDGDGDVHSDDDGSALSSEVIVRIATGHYARLCHRHPLPGGVGDGSSMTISNCFDDDDDNDEERARNDALLEDILSRHIDEEGDVGWIGDWGLDDRERNKHPEPQAYPHPQPLLVAGADPRKDQSYFLSMVPGDAFRNVVFPLGHLYKDTPRPRGDGDGEKRHSELGSESSETSMLSVREIAREANLVTATKRESMGICFVGNTKDKNRNGRRGDFGDFVGGFVPRGCTPPGRFVCVDTGEVVGTHDGRGALLTIGQGARIGGASRKWFVVGKRVHFANDGGVIVGDDGTTRTVLVCGGTHHPALYVDELDVAASEFNWIGGGGGGGGSGAPPPILEGEVLRAHCRIRHLQPLVPCTVERVEEQNDISSSTNKLLLRIAFDRPVRGVTPGQIAALYAAGGLVCLGGGPILRGGPTYHERGLVLPHPVSMLHPAGHNDLSVLSSS